MRCISLKKIFDDRNLLTLVLIVIVCSVCKLFGSKLNIVIYFFLLLHFKVIIKAKDDEILPIILFNHTCSALYDSIGFTYLFNFTIFIFVLKLFFKKKSVPKKSSLLLVILFLYNALIMIYGNFFSMSIIMSTFSLFISYVFIIFISNNCGIIDYILYSVLLSATACTVCPSSWTDSSNQQIKKPDPWRCLCFNVRSRCEEQNHQQG